MKQPESFEIEFLQQIYSQHWKTQMSKISPSKRLTNCCIQFASLGLVGLITLLAQFDAHAAPVCNRNESTCEPTAIVTPQSTKTITVPTTLLTTIVNNLIQGSELHLNNFGPKHGKSWHKPNDSFIKLSQALGGTETRFTLPEKRINLDCGTFCPDLGTGRFYVQDWNLAQSQVTWQNPHFKLSLSFESTGREIKGFHTGTATLGDSGIPDAQIDNARLDIYVKPVVSEGRLTYLVASTDFNSSIQATGACNVFGIDICNRLFQYKSELTSQVESEIKAKLNDRALRDHVTNALQLKLNQLGIGTITQVSVNGENLVIQFTGS